MYTNVARLSFRIVLLAGCATMGSVTALAQAQLTAVSPQSLTGARADSMRAGDQRLMRHLQQIMDLDSALAMSALPRLKLDVTRDLARATVIDHRRTGDSLRSGSGQPRTAAQSRTRHASRLEEEARRRLRLANANIDLSYVINAIALQQQALRVIDGQLTAGLQTETARIHIAAARQNTLDRLSYAEQLRGVLSGERGTRR